MSKKALHFSCYMIIYIRLLKQKSSVNSRNASVAQWIEQCPPEACAAVRLRSDALIFYEKRIPIRDSFFICLKQIDFLCHDIMSGGIGNNSSD